MAKVSKSQEISVRESVEKTATCALFMGMQMGAATVQNSMEVPQNINTRTTIWPSNSTTRYLAAEYENTNLKRYMYPYVYCSLLYKNQDVDTS